MNENTIIRCNRFININDGPIISVNSSQLLQVEYCKFANVTTSSYPACFYAEKCKTIINHCVFAYCSALGGNEKYGNGFYCYKCNNSVESCSVLCCSFQQSIGDEIPGDSAIALVDSISTAVSYINSTKCYGNDGSASVTILNGTAETYVLSFFMVTDAHEYDAIEIEGTATSYIKLSCIINSTDCFDCVLNNYRTKFLCCQNCTFINPHHQLIRNNDAYTFFEFCYSNNKKVCENCSIINDYDNILYLVPININYKCATYIQKNYSYVRYFKIMIMVILK